MLDVKKKRETHDLGRKFVAKYIYEMKEEPFKFNWSLKVRIRQQQQHKEKETQFQY